MNSVGTVNDQSAVLKRLSVLPYSQLQKQAKKLDIRANQRKEQLIEDLARKMAHYDEVSLRKKQPKQARRFTVAVSNVPEEFDDAQDSKIDFDDTIDSKSPPETTAKRISTTSKRRRSRKSANLNETFSTNDENNEAGEYSNVVNYDILNDSEQSRRRRIMDEITERTEKIIAQNQHKSTGKPLDQVEGRFTQTHKKLFAKMENIETHSENRHKRRQHLTRGTTQRTKQLATPKMTKTRTTVRHQPSDRAFMAKKCPPSASKFVKKVSGYKFDSPKIPNKLNFKFGKNSPSQFQKMQKSKIPDVKNPVLKLSKLPDNTVTNVGKSAVSKVQGFRPYKGKLPAFVDTANMSASQLQRHNQGHLNDKNRNDQRLQLYQLRAKKREDVVNAKRGIRR